MPIQEHTAHRPPAALAYLKGTLFALVLGLSTIIHCSVLYVFALARVVPSLRVKVGLNRIMNGIAGSWVSTNSACIRVLHRPRWRLSGLEGLDRKRWYLITANHQSWGDILIMQRIFFGKIPTLKFFLKQRLIWVPVIGLAWWALDFPFMKRYSRTYLEKNPHLKGKDLEATQRACEKFKHMPTSIINFAEGTRFTTQKHQQQQSPYRRLLKPRAGGLAFALGAMQGRIDEVLDVTIYYPQGAPTFWGFMCGAAAEVIVEVKKMPASDLEGYADYYNNEQAQNTFQQAVSQLWQQKDDRLSQLIEPADSRDN